MKVATSRLTIKGQVTIPKTFREHLKINEGESVCFSLNEQNEVVLSRVNSKRECPMCERGFIHDFNQTTILRCPLCQGEELLCFQSISDWIKAAIDTASVLDISYELYRVNETYTLVFYSDGLALKEKVLVEEFQQFIQRQINAAVQKEMEK